MRELTLALDWTPNINHIGFFVAKEKGFYKNLDINLKIIDPSTDNYQITPAKKVELAFADFALCPTESIISYQTKENSFDLVAIAAILKEDLSAIVVKKQAGIISPKDLDNKIYSSYKAKYEDAIVKQMIKNDGGSGNIKIIYPEKLGIWNTLLNGDSDATWIFLNWEGIEAENYEEELTFFKMKEYGIPYSYSPVIASSLSKSIKNKQAVKDFLTATKEGFLYCKDNPEESSDILSKFIVPTDHKIDLKKALAMSVPYFGDYTNWGELDKNVISDFIDWIKDKNLEDSTIKASTFFTNQFLK